MKKTFAARRVPRKIGQDNDGQDDDESPTAAATEVAPQAGEPLLSTATQPLYSDFSRNTLLIPLHRTCGQTPNIIKT
jgi:hypothetical protein